jgi:putative two-component system response regulator
MRFTRFRGNVILQYTAATIAIADNYDALRTQRVYKKPFAHEECCSIIQGLSGTHFAPELVDAFRGRAEEFRRISLELAD